MIGALALLVLAGAVAVLVLTLRGPGHIQRVRDYAFDSHYQLSEAESRLTERVLDTEMARQELNGGGEVRVRKTRCVVVPPPPAAHRMSCSVTVELKEVRSKITVTRYIEHRASIAIDPNTGALKLDVAAPRRGPKIVTPRGG